MPKSRRLFAIFELLGLIVTVLVLISISITFMSASEKDTDVDLKEKVERLDNEFEGMKVEVDEWKEFSEEINLELEGDKTKEEEEEIIEEEEAEEEEEEEAEEPETTEVNADELNVRSKASTESNVVTTINSGSVVELTGKTKESGGYDWTQIELSDGTTGWVVTSFLK